jgi:maltose alpha-D-glucosyltransferase / alpha-amylase
MTAPTRTEVAAAIAALDREAVSRARWFGAKGRAITAAALEHAFLLDASAPHVLAIIDLTLDDGTHQRYTLALTGSPLREATPGEGTWRSLGAAIGEGRTIAALPDPRRPDAAPSAALVCRPAAALARLAPDGIAATERDLAADQSNTSVVVGDHLLLKAYRRLRPGLNPDLEMTAFLAEEAGFPAVPRLGGFAEIVTREGATTVAMLQEWIADGTDAFESIAEALVAWLTAPGEVSLEFATEIAADLGTLTAGLHAAVADARAIPDMTPRTATRDEIGRWGREAHRHLAIALEVAPDEAGTVVRDLAPRIAEVISLIDALPTAPEVIRAHGDFHLGQVLIAPDGFRIVDFEGEPLRSTDERRAHRPALRDLASMLRSIDHVARSARRRAEARQGAPLERPSLDLDAWHRRARERFLEAYRAGLLERHVPADIDPDLLRAFEVDKELYEFAYAATYLPTWLYAPTEGMRWLIEEAG